MGWWVGRQKLDRYVGRRARGASEVGVGGCENAITKLLGDFPSFPTVLSTRLHTTYVQSTAIILLIYYFTV